MWWVGHPLGAKPLVLLKIISYVDIITALKLNREYNTTFPLLRMPYIVHMSFNKQLYVFCEGQIT